MDHVDIRARRRARDSRTTHIVTSRRTRDAPHFAMRSAICASAPFASRGPSPRRARAPRRLPVASAARAPDDTPALVVVIGAGGRTGSEVCRHCVSIGLPVRACTRTGLADPTAILGDDAPAAVVPWSSPLVRAVAADVTVPDQLPPAVAGASLVVFAATAPAGGDPDAVDHRGLAETARACIAAGVPRLVVVSGAGVTKPASPAYRFLNLFGGRMDAKVAGEDAVRDLYRHLYRRAADSNRRAPREGGGNDGYEPTPSYTIVRPSGLLDGPGTGPSGLATNQGDEAAGFVNRADVAECCVAAGRSPATRGCTFEIYAAGTAVATETLSLADILCDPTAAAAAEALTQPTRAVRRLLGGSQETPGKEVTARERRGGSWDALFEGVQPDA